MLSKYSVLLVLVFLLCTSCSFFNKTQDIPQDRALWSVEETASNENNYVSFGRVINAEWFKWGGDIVVLPFDVPENLERDDLGQAALMVVRGIIDVFEDCYGAEDVLFPVCTGLTDFDKGKHNLIFARDKGDADFVLKGEILEVRSDRFLGLPLGNKGMVLSVQGKITEKSTGNTVATFKDERVRRDSDEKLKDMAQRSGQNIGQFIFKIIKED